MGRTAETAERLTALRRAIAALEGRPAGPARLDAAAAPAAVSGGAGPSAAPAATSGGAGADGEAQKRRAMQGAASMGHAAAGAAADLAACEAPGRAAAGAEVLGFGVEAIDRRLGAGGLLLGALHEIACDESREAGAVTGLAAALLARLVERRAGRVLWIVAAEARREAGRLDGPGLAALGLDPGRLVEVAAPGTSEALWAFEEGLACRGTAAVVAEIPGRPAALDLTATRRLALRAGTGGGEGGGRPLALLLRVGGPAQTTAAATRWRVRAARSRALDGFAPGLGLPAFRLELEKNRDGRLGGFEVEWSCHDRCFALLPAHSGAVPADASDRPAAPAGEGRVLAFERPVRR